MTFYRVQLLYFGFGRALHLALYRHSCTAADVPMLYVNWKPQRRYTASYIPVLRICDSYALGTGNVNVVLTFLMYRISYS